MAPGHEKLDGYRLSIGYVVRGVREGRTPQRRSPIGGRGCQLREESEVYGISEGDFDPDFDSDLDDETDETQPSVPDDA